VHVLHARVVLPTSSHVHSLLLQDSSASLTSQETMHLPAVPCIVGFGKS